MVDMGLFYLSIVN